MSLCTQLIHTVSSIFFKFFMCIGVCLHVCLSEGVGLPGTGNTDICELPCGCWELNLDPLEEHSVSLLAVMFLALSSSLKDRTRCIIYIFPQ